MNRKWQRFKYYYKISPILLVKRLVDKILAPIYRHEVGLMTLTEVPVNPVNKNNGETECIFLKTPASLKIWEKDISNLIPINELKEHLADDVGNIVIFATQPKSSGSGRKVIAYRKIQQRVFSDDWGIKGKLSADTLSIDYTEVLPEYRGQRVNRVLMDATQEYCRQNSISKYIGIIVSHNQPSITHSLRQKETKIIGKIELFSLFGGMFKRVTSWEEVKKIIDNS